MGFSLGKTLKGAISGAVSGGAVAGIPGAIAGGVIGAGSGFLDAYQDRSALDYQNKQNIKLWNMTNQYNTPAAQMQRFMDAGLNPNLIYSQSNEAGSISGGTLQNNSSDIGGQIRSASQQKLNTLSAYSSLASAQAQREYIQAQTANIGYNQRLEDRRLRLAEALLPYQIKQMEANSGGRIAGIPISSGSDVVDYVSNKSKSYGEKVGEWFGDKSYELWKRFHAPYSGEYW